MNLIIDKLLMFRIQNNLSWFAVASAVKKKTYYQILQLPSNAPVAAIKKNYYRLAKIYHPDVYKGKDKTRFQKIQEAYKTLSDQIKRRQYDATIGLRDQSSDSSHTESRQQYKQDYGKQKNTMDYDKKTEQINIDEEYEKFFKQKPKTHFEEIKMHQPIEFRNMTESERVRRHFTQAYQSQQQTFKTSFQKQFKTILDDQIDQNNQLHQDNLKTAKKMEDLNRPQSLRKKKKWLFFLFAIFCLGSLPVINSFMTKYQLQRKQQEAVKKIWEDIQKEAQQIQIRQRFQY